MIKVVGYANSVESLTRYAHPETKTDIEHITVPIDVLREFARRLQAAGFACGRDEPLTGADLDPLEAIMQGWQP